MKYIIVGYGNIGKKRRNALGNKCIATIDPDKKTQADYSNVAQFPKHIIEKTDAVIITIPRYQKNAAVKYWLSKGKHVLVEKPLIITPPELKKLLTIAKKNKVIWYTGYNLHFEPHIVKVKKLLNKKFLGKIYKASIIYGFGNAEESRETWREKGSGVIEEICCHLIYLSNFLFGYALEDVHTISLRKIELKTFDYSLFSTNDMKIIMEAGWIMWKNIFQIEAFGEKGSIHLNGLCKWGASELITRKRVFPSGPPIEKKYILKKDIDPTWERDINYFETLVKKRKIFTPDLPISNALISLLQGQNPKISKQNSIKLLGGHT